MRQIRHVNEGAIMKHPAYILGSIEALAGVLLLSVTAIIKEVMPILGRIAFQSAAAGSYSPENYAAAFPLPIALSVLLIAAGAVQIVYAVLKKET